jgi:hypothetical protein
MLDLLAARLTSSEPQAADAHSASLGLPRGNVPLLLGEEDHGELAGRAIM